MKTQRVLEEKTRQGHQAQAGVIRPILLVDDSPEIRHMFERTMTYFYPAYPIILAANGPAALARLREQGPVSLVVTDYQMPGMNGIELARRIRQEWPETPVVLMSVYPKAIVPWEELKALRLDGFLQKPFPMQQLQQFLPA